MRTYTCPQHGEYTDQDFPENVATICCIGCIQARETAAEGERDRFHAEYRAWHGWMRSGIPARGLNRSLANWTPEGSAQLAAHKLITQWASHLLSHARKGAGLTLLGPPGVGKTHLAYALVAEAWRARLKAAYVVWGDVVDRHKSSFGKRESDEARLIGELKEVPLLTLDEVGVRPGSEFDQNLLFELIDTRYRNQRTTVVATNLTVETLDIIGERAADRLREMNVSVSIPGKSYRQAAATDRSLLDAPPVLVEPPVPVIPFKVSRNGDMVDRPATIELPEMT